MKQQLVTLSLLGLIVFTVAGGCASRKKTGQGDLSQPIAASSFARHWYYPITLKNDSVDRLFVRGDTVFVYTKNHVVYGLGAEGGEYRFFSEPEVSGGVLRPPVLLGEHVIYPCGSTIDVFNKLGRKVRSIRLEKPTRSGAVGDGGKMLYIGLDHPGGYGVIASIDITQPYRAVNWELLTFGAVSPTPTLFDRVIYGGAEDGRLYAVSEERGQVWALENGSGTFNTQGKFVSDIKADDFGVYASNTDSKVYCLERLNGKTKWQFFSGVPLKTDPVVTAGTVYQYVPGAGMVAIDKTTGDFNRRPRWIVKNATQVLSEDQKNVYLRRKDNRIMAIDKASGELVFLSKRTFDVFTTNLQSPVIYAAMKNGQVYGIHPVLQEGEVGHQVRGVEFKIQELALASAK